MIDPISYPTGVHRVSSGLAQEEIAALWAVLERALPWLHEAFLNPDYDSDGANSALKARDEALRDFIRRAFWDALPAAQVAAISLEMRNFFYCRKLGLDKEEPPFS